jgi:hypothetical protein
MIDPTNQRIAPAVPFMTGAFKDAALARNLLFSIETALAEYAAANAAKAPLAAAPPIQVIAATPVTSQILAAAPTPHADSSFVPAFRKATGTDGAITWSLNSTYFATKETAQWIAAKFGTGEVAEVPFGGNGGIFASDANELHIKLKDGRLVNAGLLAGYFERNPPGKFPGLAEKLIRDVLGLV